MQLALTPPSVGARATADGNASGASGQWDDADQALMELLLLDSQDVAASPSPSPPPHKDRAVTIEAKTKTKAKLTATEKKARHREVVRRSYHRTKATTKVLKDEVKQLEEQFRALTSGRSADAKASAGASASANEASLARIDALKEQVASLDATTEQLRKESAKLQFGLLRHQEYARVVVETFQDDLMDESTSEDDEDTTSTTASLGSSSTASSDDGSPVRAAGVKRALYAIPRPTHVVDLSQPAPVAREARKDIGFVPLKPMDVKLICNATVSDIVNFTLSGRVVSSGARVLGWEDRRLIDGPTVRFSLRKTFPSRNSYDLMAKTWQCFSDPECVHQKFQGLMELRILQRVNDDTVIALRDTLNPENNKVYRFVFMLFRMRTTRGFLIGVKSLDDPKFITEQHKHTFTRDGREIQWVDLSGWFLFDRQVYVDPHTGVAVEAGAEVEYGGVMNYGDVAHTMTLAMNTLSLVLKWESFMIGPIFALPPSSD